MNWPALTPEIRVVTFDIFDTLLHRRLRAPVDVFDLVRLQGLARADAARYGAAYDGFPEARRAAEASARARMAETGAEPEVTLDEIHAVHAAAAGLPEDVAGVLKTLELRTEAAVLCASVPGMACWRAARAADLEIALLSDMYLPPDWLAGRLEALGFEGAETVPVYLSGDVRLSKRSGGLFRHCAQAQGWSMDAAWLHLGDNPAADLDAPRALGLRAEHANWADARNLPLPACADGGGTVAASVARAQWQPQAQQRLPDDPLGRIAYRVWGPLIFGFVLWLAEQTAAKGLDRLLFVARDGQLPMKAFARIAERAGLGTVETRYIYFSRAVGYRFGQRDWDSDRVIHFVGTRGGRSPRRAFAAAGLSVDDYLPLLADHGLGDPDSAVPRHRTRQLHAALNAACADILRTACARQRKVATYFDDAVAGGGRIGFVDIGWMGNVQRCFVQAIEDIGLRDRLNGLYLGLHEHATAPARSAGLRLDGWMNGGADPDRLSRALTDGGVELLEFVLTADHGSTLDLRPGPEGVRPVLEDQGAAERAYQAQAAIAQEAVLRFVDDHLFLLDLAPPRLLSSPAWADPFLRLALHPTAEEAEILGAFDHADAPGGTTDRQWLAPRLPWPVRAIWPVRRQKRAQAFWKAGFDRRNALLPRFGPDGEPPP